MGVLTYFDINDEDKTNLPLESVESDSDQSLPPLIWTWKESLLVIPLGLIVIGTILGNFLVLYSAVTRSHTLKLPTHFIIANLAIADFLVGIFVLPFLATLQVTGRWYFGDFYCEFWTVTHFWLCAASILSTCAVCIERYIGVRYPLNHREIMTSRRLWGLILCVWVLAGLLALCSLYIWPQPKSGAPLTCEINQQIGHVILAVVGILYVPAIVMIILYWRIFVIATRHLRFLKNNSSSVPPKLKVSAPNNKRFSNGLSLSIVPESDASTAETSFSSSSPRNSSEDLDQVDLNDEKKGSAVSGASAASTAKWNLVRNVQSRKQINLAKRLSMLVGILLISYVPFFTLYMVMAFKPGSIDGRVFNAFGWIRYFNSCLNPFIYAFAVPAYRKAMKDIIQKTLKKCRLIRS